MGKQSVIYLAGDELVLVQAKPTQKQVRVNQFYRQPLPTGTVFNGVITNEEALAAGLAELRQAVGKPAAKALLVIDSNQIMAKPLSVPAKLTPKQVAAVAARELSEVGKTDDEHVYDYGVLQRPQKPGETPILCTAITRERVNQMQELFSKAGIQLTGVTSALAATLRTMEFVPELSGQSLVLCVLNGQTLVCYLFAEGQYLMNSRTRIITDRGSPAVISELLGRISSMLQFSQSHKDAEPAKTVYFCGLDSAEVSGCKLVADTFHVTAQPLPAFSGVRASAKTEFVLADAFAPVGALLPSKLRSIDFLAASRRKSPMVETKTKKNRLPFWPLILSVLAIGALTGVALYSNNQLQTQLDGVNAYLLNADNIALEQQVNLDRLTAQHYQAATAEVQRAMDVLNATVQPDANFFARANVAAGETIFYLGCSYNATSHEIHYSCWTPDYRNIPTYISNMYATFDYVDIDYPGYSQAANAFSGADDNGQAGAGYSFNITCTIKGAE